MIRVSTVRMNMIGNPENSQSIQYGSSSACRLLRILGNEIIELYRNRVMNIHPSLLPAFKRASCSEASLWIQGKSCRLYSTLCRWRAGLRTIILQRCVPVLPGDTEETLTAESWNRSILSILRQSGSLPRANLKLRAEM